MKRFSLVLLFVLALSFVAFASNGDVLKYSAAGDEIEVINFEEDGDEVCDDNVRFLNRTNFLLDFVVYGKREKSSPRELLAYVSVDRRDTQQETTIKKLDEFKYVYVVPVDASVRFSRIACEHSDMYFYIESATPYGHGGRTSVYQSVVQRDGASRSDVYEGIFRTLSRGVGNTQFYIEENDKVQGLVSGWGVWTKSRGEIYKFGFRFEVKDGRYRVTFSDIEADFEIRRLFLIDTIEAVSFSGDLDYLDICPGLSDTINAVNNAIDSMTRGRKSDNW